jgi:hypothetical protein
MPLKRRMGGRIMLIILGVGLDPGFSFVWARG